jgi:hypothetical protein
MEDRPGMLGKCCKALGERGVNIMAFQSFIEDGKSVVRLVVDNAANAKAVFDNQRLDHKENEVAQVRLPNKPGELGRAASQLGDANININYAYCGIEPKTNSPLVIFGVKDVSKAAPILDEVARKAA